MHPLHPQQASDVAALTSLIPFLKPKYFPDNFTFRSVEDPTFQADANTLYILITAILLCMITTSLVCLRFWIRSRGQFGMDDWVMVPAFLTQRNNTVALIDSGFGYHLMELSIIDIKNFLIVQYIHTILWTTSLYLTRCSILHLLIRITPVTNRKARIYLYLVNAASYVYLILSVCLEAFECSPVSATFNIAKVVSGKYCKGTDSLTLYGILCIGHVILDLLTIIPPMVVIARISLNSSKKSNILVLLGLGVVSIICTTVRIFVFFKTDVSHFDITWNATPVGLLGVIEVSIALSVACLPAVNHWIRRYAVSVVESLSPKGTQNSSSTDHQIKIFAAASKKKRRIREPLSLPDDMTNFTVIDEEQGRLPYHVEVCETELRPVQSGLSGDTRTKHI